MANGHRIRIDMRLYLKFYKCDKIVNDYPYLKKIKLYHNTRFRKTLGMAYLNSYAIDLSTRVIEESFDNVRETLIHELCHIIAAKSFNAGGHDRIFKDLHRKYLNLEGNPTFHCGILTTQWVKEDGRWVVRPCDHGKWIRASNRIDDLIKKKSSRM